MADSPTDRAAIEREQLALLGPLLARLLADNAFYAPRLRGAGFDDRPVESLADFAARCPVLTKQQLADDQAAHPPFGTNRTEPIERYTRYHQTSGTTASPLRWLDTDESWSAMIDVWCEVFGAAGVGPGDRVMFTFSFGPFIGFWLAFESARRLGALCIPGGGLSSAARLAMMIENQATVLCCTPTYALRLGQVAVEQQIDLHAGAISRIIVGGEPGGSVPATREAIETLWPGARVIDHHGMTEVGPATYSDPDDPSLLRLVEPVLLAEVVDPTTLQPVPTGHRGELLLTTLHRAARPALRYRTGDIVERADVPGRFAMRGGIIGRADEMICVRGVNVYPAAVDQIVRGQPGVAEYRVTVARRHGLAELELEIEPAGDGDPPRLVEQLAERFRAALSLRVPIRVVGPGELPRFEMKAKRWVRP